MNDMENNDQGMGSVNGTDRANVNNQIDKVPYIRGEVRFNILSLENCALLELPINFNG